MARKVLVVDDSATEVALITSSLRAVGFEVVTASNGEEALAHLERETPDAIVLDVIMPGKNGFQVCREIRADQRWAALPIVMVTSKDQESDKFWGMKQGASEYITKPFAPESLVAAVRRYMLGGS
jgi:twitching motility two-component system response regulator PilH